MTASARLYTLPILPLDYGTVLFPGKTLNISPANRDDVSAFISKYYSGALQTKNNDNSPLVACVPLRSPYLSADGKKLIEDSPKADAIQNEPNAARAVGADLFDYGCIAKIAGIRGGRRGEVALVLEGQSRCKLEKVIEEKPYMYAQTREFKESVDIHDQNVKGAFAQLKELSRELFQIIRLSSMVSRGPGMSPLLMRQLEAFVARKDVADAGFLADFMAVLGQSSYEDRLSMLAATSVITRLQRAIELIQRQMGALQGNAKIITVTNNSQGPVDIEKIRELQKRNPSGRSATNMPPGFGMPPGMGGSGSADDGDNEIEELKKRLDEAGLSAEAQKVANREIKRLQKMMPAQAEYSVIRNYLENLAEIPWTKYTQDNLDAATLQRARKQLDDDHYGLDKIKKRLLEYLAVLKLKQSANAALEEQIKMMSEKEEGARKAEQSQQKDEQASHATGNEGTGSHITPSSSFPRESLELQELKGRRMVDKSPILLLVGPPGTGKTSLAKSVATSLGRQFHRISLGGVRDEAEIRGHRRTYVAAMPGLIVSGLKKAGVANPVFLLDEIDKLGGSNFHGDPSAAMLEVLDPEQNHTFTDHYLNIPMDLSKVLFIATANTLDTIPPALLDRMETISLAGYTTLEKRHIANRHLVPKQIRSNGLRTGDVEMPDDVVDHIITAYTRESGVRNLEREIGSVCRYKAVQYAEHQDTQSQQTAAPPATGSSESKALAPYHPNVRVQDLEDILGIEKFTDELALSQTPRPGVVTGLVAFSSLGQGSILFIEVLDMPGSGRVQLTGKLGDVLKESVEVALTWVKAHAYDLGITADENEDIMARRALHVHCPAGAVPKDGPSAGLAHTVALVSLFTGHSVPATIAMTGEVSLRGKVTPVGGIKEKLIGALRAGVKTCLLPKANYADYKDCPEEVKKGMEVVFVEGIWEALRVIWPEERWGGEGARAWGVDSRL